MIRRERDTRKGAIWGVVMILAGLTILLAQQGIIPREFLYEWWEWWPAILTVVGISHLIRPSSPRDIGSGVTSILMSFWFFATLRHWFDLDWHTSWPLALVAVGAGMTARALATTMWRHAPEQEESRG